MAIRINFAGASLLIPGAYSNTQVAESGLASPALGVIALVGESDEGPAFADEAGLSAVTFGPDEFAAMQEKFGSGELLDAARAAISPSNDPAIQGGAQQLILMKTNASVKAEADIVQSAAVYGTVLAKKAGEAGNKVSVKVAVVSSQAIITLTRLDTGVSEVSEPLGGNNVMTLQCTDGTAASVTITATKLTTALTGATTAAALDLSLANFNSVKELVEFINAQPGYIASAASSAMGILPVSVLDRVSAQNILTASSIKKDAYEVREFFAASSLADFEPTIFAGLPTVSAKAFLTGGARGATSQSAIQDAIDALMKTRINFLVPLFSRDAADDIADGITDTASNYTINSVHAAANAHVNQASTVKGRKERQAFVGHKAAYEDTAERAAELSAARVQMCFQDVDVISASTGLLETKQPHMLAVLSAAMKCSAPVGTPNTFKQPQISGFSHEDFDPETQGEKAIADNLCYVEKAPDGGFRIVLDNSTYSQNLNAWIFNRPSVLYAADTAAYSIRLNTEVFIGRRNSDVSVETVKNQLVGVLDQLRSAGIIVADNNTRGRGYKDLNVRIVGSIVYVTVTLALVEGLEFVLSDIKVQRAA